MATVIQRESTEFVYEGVTGTVPTTAEIAFLAAGVRPLSGDWSSALLVLTSADALWADAVASGAKGDYYFARLVGSYGGTGVVLTPGDWQVWLRGTGTTERWVRIAPVALTVA